MDRLLRRVEAVRPRAHGRGAISEPVEPAEIATLPRINQAFVSIAERKIKELSAPQTSSPR